MGLKDGVRFCDGCGHTFAADDPLPFISEAGSRDMCATCQAGIDQDRLEEEQRHCHHAEDAREREAARSAETIRIKEPVESPAAEAPGEIGFDLSFLLAVFAFLAMVIGIFVGVFSDFKGDNAWGATANALAGLKWFLVAIVLGLLAVVFGLPGRRVEF